jgi:hypothetical protein
MTNHNTPQLSRMDLPIHCAAFPRLSAPNARPIPVQSHLNNWNYQTWKDANLQAHIGKYTSTPNVCLIKLTIWERAQLNNLNLALLVKEFHTLYGNRNITIFTTGLICNQMDPIHIPTLFLNIHFNIIFPFMSSESFLPADIRSEFCIHSSIAAPV